MMSDKRKIFIERIKNVLIVVLFLTTVLLLSFFLKDISLRDLSPINIIEDSVNSYIPEPNDLIQLRNILFSFGSDTYTLKKEKKPFEDTTVTDKMMELMRKYIGEASYAEQIQAEQYEEVMSYASVNMRFDYSIPVEEFIKENDISYSVNLGDLTNFSVSDFLQRVQKIYLSGTEIPIRIIVLSWMTPLFLRNWERKCPHLSSRWSPANIFRIITLRIL